MGAVADMQLEEWYAERERLEASGFRCAVCDEPIENPHLVYMADDDPPSDPADYPPQPDDWFLCGPCEEWWERQ